MSEIDAAISEMQAESDASKESYIDLKHRYDTLREELIKYKNDFAEFRTQYDTQRRLLDKAITFLAGVDATGHDITVDRRSEGRWAVVSVGSVLSSKNEWVYEGLASGRTEEFKANTRFPFDIAMIKAEAMTIPQKSRAAMRDKVIES